VHCENNDFSLLSIPTLLTLTLGKNNSQPQFKDDLQRRRDAETARVQAERDQERERIAAEARAKEDARRHAKRARSALRAAARAADAPDADIESLVEAFDTAAMEAATREIETGGAGGLARELARATAILDERYSDGHGKKYSYNHISALQQQTSTPQPSFFFPPYSRAAAEAERARIAAKHAQAASAGAGVPARPWAPPEVRLLLEAYVRFPGGTRDRWERMAEVVPGRSAAEIVKKVKEIKKNQLGGKP
jgi:hypothetical protein